MVQNVEGITRGEPAFLTDRKRVPSAGLSALRCDSCVLDFEAGILHLQEVERSPFGKTREYGSCTRKHDDDDRNDDSSTGLQRAG
jgi:hypothetical protein